MIINQSRHHNGTTITLTDQEFEKFQNIFHSLEDDIQKEISELNGYLDGELHDSQCLKDWKMFFDIIYHRSWPFIQLLPYLWYAN